MSFSDRLREAIDGPGPRLADEGFDQGLVDFHGRLDEREILWCWKHDEDRITHWHELEAGFAGRQPLPEVLSRT